MSDAEVELSGEEEIALGIEDLIEAEAALFLEAKDVLNGGEAFEVGFFREDELLIDVGDLVFREKFVLLDGGAEVEDLGVALLLELGAEGVFLCDGALFAGGGGGDGAAILGVDGEGDADFDADHGFFTRADGGVFGA